VRCRLQTRIPSLSFVASSRPFHYKRATPRKILRRFHRCTEGMSRGDEFPVPPHSCFGDPNCYGYLNAAIHEMELALDVCAEICPHCGMVSLFPGCSDIITYWCQHCGKGSGLAR
jgi:hypothetical protein